MATLVAWNMAAKAAACNGGSSCSHSVKAEPNGGYIGDSYVKGYYQTEWVQEFGCIGKAKVWCDPVSGCGKEVTVTIKAAGWVEGGDVEHQSEGMTIIGSVGPNGKVECFSIDGTAFKGGADKMPVGLYVETLLRWLEVGPFPNGNTWKEKTYVRVSITEIVAPSEFDQTFKGEVQLWKKHVVIDPQGIHIEEVETMGADKEFFEQRVYRTP